MEGGLVAGAAAAAASILLLGARLRARSFASSPSRPCRKVRVLVDMDGVLCDFDRSINEELQRRHPGCSTIPLNERTEFYASRHYGEVYGEEAKNRVNAIIRSEGFIENLPEISGCVEAVKAIDALPNVEVFFCTSPLGFYNYVLKEKFAWIEAHFGKEWVKKIVITKDKTIVRGRILIDDKPCITGADSKPEWEHVIFRAACNRNVKGKRCIERWADWRSTIGDIVM